MVCSRHLHVHMVHVVLNIIDGIVRFRSFAFRKTRDAFVEYCLLSFWANKSTFSYIVYCQSGCTVSGVQYRMVKVDNLFQIFRFSLWHLTVTISIILAHGGPR